MGKLGSQDIGEHLIGLFMVVGISPAPDKETPVFAPRDARAKSTAAVDRLISGL
jgi:hypothetical protein